MIYRIAFLVPLFLAGFAAGCVATPPSGQTIAAAPDRAAFVGTWVGQTERGGSILITVPASGKVAYRFRGQAVTVNSATVSGNSLMLSVGRGGRIALSPSGEDRLRYAYAFGRDAAGATLSRR